ncbi:hypothetical protein CURTO8I2_120057 [Curtobacterium sp. 8I-2]|nr:hypothetical protein CURTO8I2_120057 [Curtobacterium sp. 8I-2]
MEFLERPGAEDHDAAFLAAGHDEPAGQFVPELGGEDHATLLVELRGMSTEQHVGPPLRSTGPLQAPLYSTPLPRTRIPHPFRPSTPLLGACAQECIPQMQPEKPGSMRFWAAGACVEESGGLSQPVEHVGARRGRTVGSTTPGRRSACGRDVPPPRRRVVTNRRSRAPQPTVRDPPATSARHVVTTRAHTPRAASVHPGREARPTSAAALPRAHGRLHHARPPVGAWSRRAAEATASGHEPSLARPPADSS